MGLFSWSSAPSAVNKRFVLRKFEELIFKKYFSLKVFLLCLPCIHSHNVGLKKYPCLILFFWPASLFSSLSSSRSSLPLPFTVLSTVETEDLGGGVFSPLMAFLQSLSWLQTGNIRGLIEWPWCSLPASASPQPSVRRWRSGNGSSSIHHKVCFRTLLSNPSYSPTNITNEIDSVSWQSI